MIFTRDRLPGGLWDDYRKTQSTRAKRIEGAFTVETREGIITCQDGWLALDPNGDPYPIAADVFAAVYEPVGAPA